jgi:peptide/nickel transport system permease protein
MAYLIRRIAFYLLTAWAAITVNFIVPRLMPGNPVETILNRLHSQNLTPQAVQALEIQFGFNTKVDLWSQYTHYLNQLFHGNLGISTTLYPSTVASVIGTGLPWTIGLVGLATLISFTVGTLLGVLVAWRRGSWLETLIPVTTLLSAFPYFVLGTLALLLFGTDLHWFPTDGGGSTLLLSPGVNWTYISSVIHYGTLPALTIVFTSMGGWLLGMRNMMVTTMDEDYVLVAQAKGLSNPRVITYAARNAILPSIASFSLALSFVVSGALLTEIVFSYPGVGYLLVQAISNLDYPLTQGIFLLITAAVLMANFLADAAYVLLDPRTRQEA